MACVRLPSRIVAFGLVAFGCAHGEAVTFERSERGLTLQRPAVYPETLEYNEKNGTFLVGSFREGAVYEVDGAGAASRLVNDDRLCSVLGIALDVARDRLWAVNANLGASAKPCTTGPRELAAVGVYRLSTGEPLDYVDLASLLPGPHLLNGIAVDPSGNAYVTDSFSPAIYRIDASGRATVFLRDDQFLGVGINLNGVVVHRDGFLLVVKKSDGALFRVPLTNPRHFSKVAVAQRFVGGDGLILAGKNDLVLIANETPGIATNAAFSLSSDDDWVSAKVRAVQPLGKVYPTTGVIRNGVLYVVHSRLDELIRAAPEQQGRLRETAIIRRIGRVAPR